MTQHDPPETPWNTLEELENLDFRSTITAIQDLPTLRRERRIYVAALQLGTELRQGEDRARISVIQQHVAEIVDGVFHWPEQWERERRSRSAHRLGSVMWEFDAQRRDYLTALKVLTDGGGFGINRYGAGHSVLCELINTFRTEIEHFGNNPVETLPFDSVKFGIRPALYLILKHEYLGRGGVVLCGNDQCSRFFVSERVGQRFCTPECSQRYRQRQYWIKKGSNQRKRRRAQQRSHRQSKA